MPCRKRLRDGLGPRTADGICMSGKRFIWDGWVSQGVVKGSLCEISSRRRLPWCGCRKSVDDSEAGAVGEFLCLATLHVHDKAILNFIDNTSDGK